MAATIQRLTKQGNRIVHFAVWGELEGTAELLNGSGYLFRRDGERSGTLVSHTDPELVLLGRADVADTQRQADDSAGGYAAVACGRPC